MYQTERSEEINKNIPIKKTSKRDNEKISFLSRLTQLESDTRVLKRLRLITNELLSCGAYSGKNMEEQFNNFEKLKVPEWEKDIIAKAWDKKKKESHRLFKELDKLLDDMKMT